ncbi:MAG: hypothetical protein CL912_18640 [Deltaproteobacteria bacterium]|nr:hypothetical protein [Deltaproteobacteria bacterium]|tara:strand:- start:275 stop:652 length:378 start_codon:yes stop_codon:yes gene_type:complete
MAKSPIAARVKLRHSKTGKMDVVKGALSERQKLRESFVRKSETIKSYGTLITLPWGNGREGTMRFPNAIRDGAVDFEKDPDGVRLKVIEWAIPKVSLAMEFSRLFTKFSTLREPFWRGMKNVISA